MQELHEDGAVEPIESVETIELGKEPNVSIRCARHKKRFEVSAEWVEKCSWLCPKCYAKLSEVERMRYAPASVRAKSMGSICPSPPIKPQATIPERKPTKRRAVVDSYTSPIYDTSLLPKYVMFCQKCRTWKPCHKVWFNANPYVCPACAAKMTAEGIASHRRKCEEVGRKPEIEANTAAVSWEKTPLAVSLTSVVRDFTPMGFDSYADELSQGQIERFTVDELKEAVRKGRLSKVRARIELRRRQNKSYYNDLPEVQGCQICF